MWVLVWHVPHDHNIQTATATATTTATTTATQMALVASPPALSGAGGRPQCPAVQVWRCHAQDLLAVANQLSITAAPNLLAVAKG
jgi:hypothetical protein